MRQRVAELGGGGIVFARSGSGIPGEPGAGDRFGSSIGFGTRGQILVGAAGAGPRGSGAVFVGAGTARWAFLHPDVGGIEGAAGHGDAFGWSLAG